MADVIDDLALINRALGRIGAGRIMSLDEDTALAGQVVPIHEDLVEAVLGFYDWRWARRTRVLERLAAAPVTGWAYAFAFPAEAVRTPSVIFADVGSRASPIRDFVVEGREVHTNTETASGVFVCRVSPAEWPAAFRLAYTVWLASAFAVPVTHDADLKMRLEQEALGTPSEGGRGGLIGRAIGIDAAGSGGTPGLMISDSLTSAHFGDFDVRGSNGW